MKQKETKSFRMLASIGLAHCLNDTTQWIIIALYPFFKELFSLTLTEIGMLSFAYQMSASALQPLVGLYTDKHPRPFALPAGMSVTLGGLLIMSFAPGYGWLLFAAVLLGVGSAVFHPEASRVAHLASAGRYGLAQSLFQAGGNAGQAVGPLIAFFVIQHGQHSLAAFSAIPLAAIAALVVISRRAAAPSKPARTEKVLREAPPLTPAVIRAVAILFILMSSKQVYTVCLSNYLTFYLMNKFGVSAADSQLYLFLFLGAIAAGAIVGGPVGDRIGRKWVIWFSILGAAPFALALPHLGLSGTTVMLLVVGFVMASSFSAILVFAQELMPGHIGAVAGLFFGLSFGLGGVGAVALGKLADIAGVDTVYILCSFLPLIGLLTAFLPAGGVSRQGRPGGGSA
ncbi:MAG: MFS transporter [Desulfovibrio sp.]|jgi:FSR family fosmidomycin resistance protein-like MFS transporter|nr:MFS transporter [Desulfovibrio sp.]